MSLATTYIPFTDPSSAAMTGFQKLPLVDLGVNFGKPYIQRPEAGKGSASNKLDVFRLSVEGQCRQFRSDAGRLRSKLAKKAGRQFLPLEYAQKKGLADIRYITGLEQLSANLIAVASELIKYSGAPYRYDPFLKLSLENQDKVLDYLVGLTLLYPKHDSWPRVADLLMNVYDDSPMVRRYTIMHRHFEIVWRFFRTCDGGKSCDPNVFIWGHVLSRDTFQDFYYMRHYQSGLKTKSREWPYHIDRNDFDLSDRRDILGRSGFMQGVMDRGGAILIDLEQWNSDDLSQLLEISPFLKRMIAGAFYSEPALLGSAADKPLAPPLFPTLV